MKRPVFSFRPNLNHPDQKKAWEILQGIPDGQKNHYLSQLILAQQNSNHLAALIRQTIRDTVREELKNVERTPLDDQEPAGIPSQMLDFLARMEEDP